MALRLGTGEGAWALSAADVPALPPAPPDIGEKERERKRGEKIHPVPPLPVAGLAAGLWVHP